MASKGGWHISAEKVTSMKVDMKMNHLYAALSKFSHCYTPINERLDFHDVYSHTVVG
jgi:hypothetical protein